jgi:hypothetical protein
MGGSDVWTASVSKTAIDKVSLTRENDVKSSFAIFLRSFVSSFGPASESTSPATPLKSSRWRWWTRESSDRATRMDFSLVSASAAPWSASGGDVARRTRMRDSSWTITEGAFVVFIRVENSDETRCS